MKKELISRMEEEDLFDPKFLRGDYRIRERDGGSTSVVFTDQFDPYRPGDRAGFSAETADYLVETLEVARMA